MASTGGLGLGAQPPSPDWRLKVERGRGVAAPLESMADATLENEAITTCHQAAL